MRTLICMLAGYCLLQISVSCSGVSSGRTKPLPPLPAQGVIHERVVCADDQGKTYALYIPSRSSAHPSGTADSAMKDERPYPVIIAFDPHGSGALPLKLYKDLADRYGYILMGSNDSKNGLPPGQVGEIVAAMMREACTVYPVDTNRIFFLGFSGGARVAATAAMYQVQVKGVIGCGAGLGGPDRPFHFKFDYFGIAGTADFNMEEVLNLEDPLSCAGFRCSFVTFNGKHEWPPAEVMEDAFRWITLNAMKDGALQKDEPVISEVAMTFDRRIKEMQDSGRLIEAANAARQAISCLDGLASADRFKTGLNTLELNPQYLAQVNRRQEISLVGEAEKQELMQALQAKDMAWWKARITQYEKRIKLGEGDAGSTDRELVWKDQRLMAFLSLFCYMNANAAIDQHNETAAARIIAIYELADPANPEPNYMRALLFARRSDNSAALGQLRIAVSKGFSDKTRLTGQVEFRAVTSSPEWFDLLKTVNEGSVK